MNGKYAAKKIHAETAGGVRRAVAEAGVRSVCREDCDHQLRWSASGISLPDTLETIGPRTFANFGRIEELVIPAGVRQIGAGAFEECGRLRKVTFLGSIAAVAPEVFSGCSSLKQVIFAGDDLEKIGDNAFYGCGELRRLQFGSRQAEPGTVCFPDALTEIGSLAFYACRKLRIVHLGSGVLRVGDCAFAEAHLREAAGGNPETCYGENAFRSMGMSAKTALEGVNAGDRGHLGLPDTSGLIIEGGVLRRCLTKKSSLIEVPEGVHTIGAGAFDSLWRTQPHTVRLPDSLTCIQENQALLRENVTTELPDGFLKRAQPMPGFLEALLAKISWETLSTEDLAGVYLYQIWPADVLAAGQVSSPREFAEAVLAILPERRTAQAVERAASYFTLHADEIEARQSDALEALLTGRGAAAPAQVPEVPYREAILDRAMAPTGIKPHDPIFSRIMRRETDTAAPTLLAKSAIVPYLVAAETLTRLRPEQIPDAAALIPAADATALRLRPEDIEAAVLSLRDTYSLCVETEYAAARYASAIPMTGIIASAGADQWKFVPRTHYGECRLALVRAGGVLNSTETGVRFVLEAPRWTGLYARRLQLYPDEPVVCPESLQAYALGGVPVRMGEENYTVALDAQSFQPVTRPSGGQKVWKRLPKTLPEDVHRRLETEIRTAAADGRFIQEQVDRHLFADYLAGTEISAEWLGRIAADPVLCRALHRIVFSQGSISFVLRRGAAEDVSGGPVHTGGYAGIRVAHVLELGAEAEQWRQRFAAERSRCWKHQLEEPNYAEEEIRADRFAGCGSKYFPDRSRPFIELAGVTDPDDREFMFQAARELREGSFDGASIGGSFAARDEAVRFLEISRLALAGITRRVNRFLYHLDQLTALKRLQAGDRSVLSFYALADTARINRALREAMASGDAEMTGALLGIRDRRGKHRTGSGAVHDLML